MRRPSGTRRAEQRQHAEGEGDVGRHRDAPAARSGSPGADDGEVDQRRQHRAADGRGDRQRGPADRRQLADEHLALDLEADDEEEDRHQPVVDPVEQRQRERDVADADGQVRRPQRSYVAAQGELLHTSATMAAASEQRCRRRRCCRGTRAAA